jgi:hypothetical protein
MVLLGAALGFVVASSVTAGAAPAAPRPAVEGTAAMAAPPGPAPSAAVPSGMQSADASAGAAGPMAPPGSASTVSGEDIRDIRGPKPVGSPWLVWVLVGIGILAAASALALWMWIRRRRRAPERSDFEVALDRLQAARALMQPGRAREFSIEVSAVVREYIERRFQVMAAHRTTHEFLHDLVQSADPALAAHRDLLGEFLQSCDLAKFGGWNLSTAQMDTMLESARRFIQSAAASAGAPQAASPSEGAASAEPTPQSASGKAHVSLPTT